MYPSKSIPDQPTSVRRAIIGLVSVVLMLGGYLTWRYYSTPPHLQASVEATKTIDALFTALTARDRDKLTSCMIRIEKHHLAGGLSARATEQLRYCQELAMVGSWEQAAKHLYWVIYEQP